MYMEVESDVGILLLHLILVQSPRAANQGFNFYSDDKKKNISISDSPVGTTTCHANLHITSF